MIRDDNTLYFEDELVELGMPQQLIWEAREKEIMVPFRPGHKRLQFLGREACLAVIELSPKAPVGTKEERVAKYRTSGTFSTKPEKKSAAN